jgi:hypothetical protein
MSIFTNTAEIILHKEGFLEIRLLDTDAPFDLEEAKWQYEVALELTKGKDYLVLVNTEGATVQPTKEAQEFLIKVNKRIAEAIVVESLAMRILSRFYVRGIKTHTVKVFKTRDQAVDWLLAQAK